MGLGLGLRSEARVRVSGGVKLSIRRGCSVYRSVRGVVWGISVCIVVRRVSRVELRCVFV